MITLTKNAHSQAHAVGFALKNPLFKLVSNCAVAASYQYGTQAKRVARIAFHVFNAVLFLIPATLLWSVGKVITSLSSHKINSKNLQKAPPRLEIPDPHAFVNVEMKDLVSRYTRLNIPSNPGTTTGEEKLEKLCNFERNRTIYATDRLKRKLFCDQLSLYLKGIVQKLQSGAVDPEVERDVLLELAEAATRCAPTWLEVAAKMYAKVNGNEETGAVKVLRLVQDYKESIVLQFVQREVNAQWHALNYVRNILGDELGLNIHLNEHDQYAAKNDSIFGKSLTKWMFMQKYENVNRLINSVTSSINSQKYDPSFYDLLLENVRHNNTPNPEDYVMEKCYTEDYKIKPEAVHFMLRCIGILT